MSTSTTNEADYWYEQVSKFINSELSQRAYCEHNNLPLKKFQKWRYKLSKQFPVNPNLSRKANRIIKKPIQANQFVAVNIQNKQTTKVETHVPLKLFVTDNAYIELPDNISTTRLQQILSAVRATAC